jgi:hypothetical protein
VGPVLLILHLRLTYETWGSHTDSSSNPSLNGQLHNPPPADIDRPLNEDVTDEIRGYRADYHNRPFNTISFMSTVTRTFDHLHCELVFILFLQDHRETDQFSLLQEFILHNPTSSITGSSHDVLLTT